MRKIGFIVGIIGLALLISFLIREPKKISSLDDVVIGLSVQVTGLVEEEHKFGSGKLLIINEIHIFCECEDGYIGKNLIVTGMVENFPEDYRVRALSIKILD